MVLESKQITFGKAVRRERNNQGLTIEQLAELVDMSERQIQNIEKGKSNPKLSTVIAIVRALECDFAVCKDGTFTLSKAEPDQKQPA